MNFGDTLRLLLEENDMTQRELALHLNLAPSTISSYIQNVREPDFAILKEIANLFGVSTDYLLCHTSSSITSPYEPEMLRVFRNLTAEQQEICIEQCRAFLRSNQRLQEKSKKKLS